MANKPQLVVVNKLDITEVRETQEQLNERLRLAIGDKGSSVHFISAATGEGVDALMGQIYHRLSEMPKFEMDDQPIPEPIRHRPQQSFGPDTVQRDRYGVYVVKSEMMERLTAMAELGISVFFPKLWREMRKSGLADKLIDAGIEAGDTIRFGKVELSWF
ncbi:MAG: hypothetical protein Ct9H300mP11_30770 [Chloroflexota bacterium]|nr:MAG: hypothetical protein Ct9H300mP11_30770 [Chloroflexota bacterium]